MKIHNIMEEVVEKKVNNLYDQVIKMKDTWLNCDCEQCRLDTTCYVLNRIQPKYVVSSRGINHTLSKKDNQTNADIEKIIIEGMRTINSVSRPYHKSDVNDKKTYIEGPVYNFPTFIGSVYDGSTFEPIENAEVKLFMNEELAPMIDQAWFNPVETTKNAKGTYSFLVKSQLANEKTKIFNFRIEVTADDYEKVIYNFELPLIKEEGERKTLNPTYTLKIMDIFLFPRV
ncbi:MAG: late competence development ComFB family protein [Treponemataceae bacterium]|nr:late competence development ComFB family protein [Treponemataceae bacterium]